MNLGQDFTKAAVGLFRSGVTIEEMLRQCKTTVIVQALRDCGGNQSNAATMLGMHRNTLMHHLDKLGIDPSRFYPAQNSGPGRRPARRSQSGPEADLRKRHPSIDYDVPPENCA